MVSIVDKRADGEAGGVGLISPEAHLFGDEHAERIANLIKKAAKRQLPEHEAGIVVIDLSTNDWTDPHSTVDACFGVESLQYNPVTREMQSVRGKGTFESASRSHVSAVVHYTRRWKGDSEPTMAFIHNPNAEVVLPETFLRAEGVYHMRRIPDGTGFRLITI